jgi:hypothetical protein
VYLVVTARAFGGVLNVADTSGEQDSELAWKKQISSSRAYAAVTPDNETGKGSRQHDAIASRGSARVWGRCVFFTIPYLGRYVTRLVCGQRHRMMAVGY